MLMGHTLKPKGEIPVKFYVIGDVTADHMHFLSHIPKAGEDIVPQNSVLLPGGAGGTMAYHAAQLGHLVTLAARVGNDPFAAVALENLSSSGVQLEAIQRDKDTMTSTVTILVTGEERTMISANGANRSLDVALLEKKLLESHDALILSAYALIGGAQCEYAKRAIGLAKKANMPIFIDLGTGAVNAAGTSLLESVRGADYLLMNQLELFRITGEDSISNALGRLETLGLQNVVVKVGALGAILWTPKESELLEGYSVENVADTTGAGDAFTVAFAHAVLSGFTLPKAVSYANIAGALAALAVGAQGAKLNHQDILARLEEREAQKAAKAAAKQTRSGKRVKPKDPPKPVLETVQKPVLETVQKPVLETVAKPLLEPAPESVVTPIPEEPKKRGRKRAG
jgi:ribokinase